MTDPASTVMRVIGAAPRDGEFLEILMQNGALQRAMLRFSGNVLIVSLIISASTLALVYLALHFMFVRPMRRITRNIMSFPEADPENPSRTIKVSQRNDEIGVTERELATMQRNLTSMLHERSRLAALGLAVSKINHDLRNMLASAQLMSDQLSTVRDARVQRFAPEDWRTLERAIDFCQSTLSYGRAQEALPDRRDDLARVAAWMRCATISASGKTAASAGSSRSSAASKWMPITIRSSGCLNLEPQRGAGAGSAGAEQPAARPDPRHRPARRRSCGGSEVSDTGPGFSSRAKEHLFEAFSGSTRPGGPGLAFAIAAELIRAHGGEIRLVEGTIGATFHLTIPDQAVDLDAWRDERASA